MDKFGLLPAGIRLNYEREAVIDDQIAKANWFDKALKKIDYRSELVWVPDNAPEDGSMIPGRWHIRRKNDPPAPHSYIPITRDDGGYREPASGDLVRLQQRDLWKERDPVPVKEEPKDDDEGRIDELATDIRAIDRLPGEGGVHRRRWGAK